MTVLFRWIFISSLMRVVAIALGIIALFMVAESFDKADLIGKSMTVKLLAEYLLLKVPFMITDLMPVIVLVGSSIYMMEISHHHELVAIRAAGVSMSFLLAPLLAMAACVGLFTFSVGEWVEPITNERLSYMERVYVSGKKPVQLHGEQWLKDDNKFLRLTPLQGKYFAFMMLESGEHGKWAGRTDASKAYYKQGFWHLEKVFVSKPDASKGIVIEKLARLSIPTSIGPTTVEPPKPKDLHWFELYRFAASLSDAGLDAQDYEYQLHKRLTGPLACFIMVILAYSLCGSMGSRISANSKGLLAALTLGLVFYVFGTSVSVLVNGGNLPVAYAAWWPNIMFLGVAGYLLLNREGY